MSLGGVLPNNTTATADDDDDVVALLLLLPPPILMSRFVIIRLLLSDPRGGGGLVWASARSQPPTHPPNPTPPRGGGSMPSTHIQVTYKHLIEKPPLAVVRRKDATPFGYLLLSLIPQNDLLAMLMKCITQRAPHQRKKCVKYSDRSQSPAQPKSQKKRTRTPGGGGVPGGPKC